MAKISYVGKSFNADDEALITASDAICREYADAGYGLTLRGLYYRLVARNLFPPGRTYRKTAEGKWVPEPGPELGGRGTTNAEPNYKWLGRVMNEARLAGRIDWAHLEDTTRNLHRLNTWEDPSHIIASAMDSFRQDLWAEQPEYVEIWVEKEALASIVAVAADRWRVPYFACRGYTSASEMHVAAQRLRRREANGKKVTIIHCGDHDPSGIDMTRDIRDRLGLFRCGADVDRIALNMDQILQYNPPPNPAKTTDSRFADYQDEFGDESWELDALDPADFDALIEGAILAHLDATRWQHDEAAETAAREDLITVSRRWDRVVELINDEPEDDDDEYE